MSRPGGTVAPPILDGRREAAFRADGFVIVDRLVPDHLLAFLHERFDRLFRGEFETGVEPDEVNWQEGSGDPTLTRQICNGWQADWLVASVVLSGRFGEAVARFAGWPGPELSRTTFCGSRPESGRWVFIEITRTSPGTGRRR